MTDNLWLLRLIGINAKWAKKVDQQTDFPCSSLSTVQLWSLGCLQSSNCSWPTGVQLWLRDGGVSAVGKLQFLQSVRDPIPWNHNLTAVGQLQYLDCSYSPSPRKQEQSCRFLSKISHTMFTTSCVILFKIEAQELVGYRQLICINKANTDK